MSDETAQAQLDEFLSRFEPSIERFAHEALRRMRARLPGAVQMVYDNYNALVIGFVPNDRPSDAILSLAVYPRYVSLCFLQGASLADPLGLLQGSGSVARHIRLASPEHLEDPQVEELVGEALRSARVPFDATLPGELQVKSISAKQRPRRPGKG
jgi:hypothetical protein